MSQPISGRAPVMVFSGDFWRGASGLGLAQGFRRHGWAVQEIDLSRLTGAFGRTLTGRALRRVLANHIRSEHEKAIRDAVDAVKPDVFFTIKGTGLSSDLLAWLKQRKIPTSVFYPDYHFDHAGVSLDVFGNYDLFVTTKSFHVDFLKRQLVDTRVTYVPHGYSDDVHWPIRGVVANDVYAYDLQHVGSHSQHKQDWLAPLARLVRPGRMRLMGARWSQIAEQLNGIEIGDSIYDCTYSLALQSSRINVSVSMGRHADGWQDNVSTRTFEVPACRGFMLHIDNDEVREFYAPGEEIDVFSSAEELLDKARFYLARPDLREAMIERAYARCVPAYGYTARASDISTLLAETRDRIEG